VAGADGAYGGEVGRQEVREQRALDHETRVRRAALLSIVEELGDHGGERVPVAVVPDAPGVQPLLLQDVAFAQVGDRGGDTSPGVAAADEGDAANFRGADQRLGEFAAVPLTSVIGMPSRAARAQARVRQATPPLVGVLAITALSASAWTSIAVIRTDMG